MREFLTVAAVAMALAAACKKDLDPPAPLPPARVVAQPAGAAARSLADPRRDASVARELAKKFHAREPFKVRPGHARFLDRIRAGKLTALAGKGTLSALVDQKPVSMPVTVFRRGAALVLSGDGPELGIVLTLPSARPGIYVRGPGATPDRQGPGPQLRVRYGAGARAQVYTPRDRDGQSSLTVEVVESSSSIRGTFRGEVALGDEPRTKGVREGRFAWTADPAPASSPGK